MNLSNKQFLDDKVYYYLYQKKFYYLKVLSKNI